MSQGAGVEEDDVMTTNNNSGHIVVDSGENNNVDGASLYNKEDDDFNDLNDSDDDEDSNPENDDSGVTDDDDYHVQRIPIPLSELPSTVTLLENNGCLVYLVGTAHFSRESQDDVSKVIRAVRPHVIMVELCQSRVNLLKMDEERILHEAKNINASTVQQVIKKNGVMQGLLNILLLNMSAYITKELGMAPGGEFRVAFHEARHLKGGCKFILGDRPIQITLRRALSALSVWQRIKLAYAILFSKEPITKEDVEKCKQKDMLEQMIEEMTGEFPALGRVFVKERDIYLAHSLRKVAQPLQCADSPGGKIPSVVVGVVGIGHVQGIKENWDKELEIDHICKIPEATMLSVIAKWSLRLSTLGLLSYGCYRLTRYSIPHLQWLSSVIHSSVIH